MNHPVHHKLFGGGIVTSVSKKSEIEIRILFEKPSNGILERMITSLEFINGQIDGLWLPPERIQQWKAVLRPIPEPGQPNSTQPKPTLLNPGMSRTQEPGSPPGQPRAGGATPKSPAKNQASKPAKAIQVRCPYCSSHFSVQEINPYIHREHPVNKHGKPTPSTAPSNLQRKKTTPAQQSKPVPLTSQPFFICPYCEAFVKPKNFSGHIQRVHPGNPIPEKPEATALRTHRKQKQELPPSVAAPEHTERPPRWGRCSGGVKIPTSMRTLSVGKRRGAVIRRKSY